MTDQPNRDPDTPGDDPTSPPQAFNPNVLRDRLANERTFLAWLRTGIAISALGFVVARFELLLSELAILEGTEFEDSWLALAIGIVLVMAGPVLTTVALVKFMRVERALLGEAKGDDGAVSQQLAIVLTVGLALAGLGLAAHLIDKWPR